MGRSWRGEEMERNPVKAYVLDTSVLVKWFSEASESDMEKALRLRVDHANNKCLIIVPDLLIYELANALRYHGVLSPFEVRESIESLIDLELEIRSLDINILNSALKLAFTYEVTLYDAYFLALAKVTQSPLITADYKFYKKVSDSKLVKRLCDC